MFGKIKQTIRDIFDFALIPIQVSCDPKSSRYKKLEARVPAYTLPDPLIMVDGRRVEDANTWFERRRPEILELFNINVYGRTPSRTFAPAYTVTSANEYALNGIATRKEVRIGLNGKTDSPKMMLLLYLPNNVKKQGSKVPLFLGLNFFGNHTIHSDPAISITKSWIPNNWITDGRAPDMLRGIQSSSWPVEFILRHGYGLATVYCGDIVPDRNDALDLGILKWLREHTLDTPLGDLWGAIGAWAWGLSRAMDYLERDADLDSKKIAVIGHSRLGKAALWAGAQDERFAMVISNESGCGGAALSRRKLGETVAQINVSFPYWFCDNFKRYNDIEDDLPVDQHELISLIAPRPVYVASAQLDLQADPMGEFLATKYASPVYRLLGTIGLSAEEMPTVNEPVMNTMGYHMRKGRHGITLYDWAQFIAFANMHFIYRAGLQVPTGRRERRIPNEPDGEVSRADLKDPMQDDLIINKSDRILITGANGFVGSKVCEILLEYGFTKLRCLVRSSKNLSELQRIAASSKVEVEFCQGNLLSRDDCIRAAVGVSVIYHLAAGVEKTFPGCFLNSVVTTRNLLDTVIKEQTLKRFVNVSSLAVYSNEKIRRGGLLDESCEIDKKIVERYEPYTYGKAKQDEIVLYYAKKHNLPYVIVRPSVVFGPGKAKITDRVGMGTFGVFLHLGLNNRIPLTYVDNCAEAIVLAGLRRGIDGQVFNISDDDLPTSRGFLKMYKSKVRRFFSIPVPYQAWLIFNYLWEKYSKWSEGQLPPVFNRRTCAVYWKGNTYSNKKAKELLGWQPRVTMNESLERFFTFMREVKGQ